MRPLIYFLGIATGMVFSAYVAAAWTGPTGSPPSGNVDAPINVGSTQQLKSGTLGVNALAVFGSAILSGAGNYLNFGTTAGSDGYGIRDTAGVLEFKNSGGLWQSLQSTIYALSGGSQWTTSGSNIYYNAGNVGIGTANPGTGINGMTVKLDLSGGVLRDTNSGANAYAYFTDGSRAGSVGVQSGTGTFVGSETSDPLMFRIGTAEKMRLDASGNLAVGTNAALSSRDRVSVYGGNLEISNPANTYDAGANGMVLGTNQNYGFIQSPYSANAVQIWDRSTNAIATFYGSDHSLSVGGPVYAEGVQLTSDARLKKNITPLSDDSSLAAIEKLNPISFSWADPQKPQGTQLGFTAQDVQQVFPDLVTKRASTTETPDGTLTLNYDGLIAPLVKAVQEQQHEIDALKAEVNALKDK